MFDLGVLDTAIAMVVVILLLSLMVQSIQTFIKKLTKFKSRQIAKSIEKLFEQVPPAPAPGGAAQTPAQLKDKVLQHFATLGRDTLFGSHALESLAKADLSKIVAAVEATHLIPPQVQGSLTNFFTSVQQVQTAVTTLSATSLSSETKAKLTELRTLLTPLVTSLEPLFTGGAFNANAVARDVFDLRNLDTTAIVKVAHELETQIQAAADAAPGNAALATAATAASTLAGHVRDASVEVTDFITRLKGRIDALESWFDTVMQGFEERYSRHMRSWAFAISLVVAVVMDANVVQLWNRLETDPQLVTAKSTLIQKRFADAAATTTSTDPKDLQTELAALEKTFDQSFGDAAALGLSVLDPAEWWSRPLGQQATSIVGWLIMAFLLSLGAPFWHDTLESLFGLKNLLRQRGNVSNVEQASGSGMTKS
ncbi:MAG TPA: hypothetical protein VFV49_12445 [Thermoanaerobaculia bacterium]|nr:hypothetical protein [Thermoanaerobaculia bacterium]